VIYGGCFRVILSAGSRKTTLVNADRRLTLIARFSLQLLRNKPLNRSVRLTCSLLIAATVLALSLPAVAQDSSPAASDQSSVANAKNAHELTLAEIEDALATLEANTEIEDSVKVMLRLKYQQAIETLKAAVSNSDKSAEYREAIKQAPAATAELRRQLVELPSASSFDDVPKFDSFDDFQQELNGKRSERTELEEQLSSVTAELNDGQQRPEEISVRIPEAEQELSEVRQQLAAEEDSQDEASVSRVADRFLLEAQKARLVSELELLNQEMLSMTVRRILQQTRKELLTRQLENASAAVAAYEASLDKSVMTQAQEITARVAELKERLPADGLANELVMEVEELAGELTDVLQDKADVAAATAAETARLQRLEQRYGGISRQLELRQSDRAMAEVLLKLRELLIRQGREPVQEPQWPTLSQARLAAVLVDSAIDDQKAVQELFADQSSDAVNKLVATRIEVLGKLRDQYLELLLALTTLESEKALYSAKAADVDAEISRQLFWMQVSPPLQMQDLIATPNGLRWVFNPMHGTEFVQSMWEEMRRAPYASAAVVFVVAALLLMRPWLRTALKRAGEGVGRVSRDRYRLTVKAILWTVLLALPVPLVVGFIAATLPLPDTLLDWLRGVRGGLRLQAGNIFMACFVAACCCPDGLGQQHYKWRTEYLYWIRRSCRWYLIVYVPCLYADILCGVQRVSVVSRRCRPRQFYRRSYVAGDLPVETVAFAARNSRDEYSKEIRRVDAQSGHRPCSHLPCRLADTCGGRLHDRRIASEQPVRSHTVDYRRHRDSLRSDTALVQD
jgi:potassium efflux system protein